MCKTVRELFSMVVNKIIFQNMIMACKIPPPHCKCHLKIPFFGRLPLGRPTFRHCLPLFCFHACSIWFDFCNYEQSKTKWKRHLEHCLWYGSFRRPKFRHCLLFFCFYDCSLFRSKPVSTSWCFGARAGALWIFEQSKTKWTRHLGHYPWYGSSGRPNQVNLKL